jgi:hypothetical protein
MWKRPARTAGCALAIRTKSPCGARSTLSCVTRTGCVGRPLPHDFPPWATVLHQLPSLARRRDQDRSHAPAVRCGRSAEGAIGRFSQDSRLVPGAAMARATSSGCEAGNRVNGRKRHLVVDTVGLVIVVLMTAASV